MDEDDYILAQSLTRLRIARDQLAEVNCHMPSNTPEKKKMVDAIVFIDKEIEKAFNRIST